MEKIIGIFDEQTAYAERLKKYINERKDIGCFAVSFRDEQELFNYCQKKNLSCLVIGEVVAKRLEELPTGLPCGIRQWILSEERTEQKEDGGRGMLFRYQKAGDVIRRILVSEMEREERLSELFTVFSPENSKLAAEYADKLVGKLAEKGKTLFLPWEPFSGYGRGEDGRAEGASVSELLYLIRKDREQAKLLFEQLPGKNGADYFCGPDYCTDLWQYSAEEMQQLILCCREYGGYKHVVFLAGTFHEGVIGLMKQSRHICLVCSGTPHGEKRKQEFYRQMKYAGEQEILSRLVEATGKPVKEG